MRISDWSSDVCSSDLRSHRRGSRRAAECCLGRGGEPSARPEGIARVAAGTANPTGPGVSVAPTRAGRSEEHTSELQSLMRISYAVFCLKKKSIPHMRTTFSYIDHRLTNESTGE